MSNVSAAFLSIAVREGFVTPEAAARYSASMTSSPAAAGILTAAQVDIVETLLRPTEVIPGYELLSHLGHGGMGVVYRARQIAFDRIVALKTVLLGTHASPTALARFEQEAKTIGRLVHPHLVTAYDFGRHQGRLFLAMEFVEGENGDEWLDRHRAAAETLVWGIIRQVAAGLAYAASANVIHRDIKPANLLLTKPPAGYPLAAGLPLVKIADFGLALLAEDTDSRTRLTSDNTTVGSPQYMAPEQLSGSRVDLRADIYALGATAYHLLTDRAPFEGLSLMQVFAQKLHGDPPPATQFRTDLSPGSFELLRDLLQRDPEQRLADYDIVLQRIDALLADLTGQTPRMMSAVTMEAPRPVATEIIPEATVARPVSRRSWIVVAVAVTLVGAVAAGYWASTGPARAMPGPRDWQPTNWAVSCYNGKTLQGWRIASGTWIPGQDDGEGGRLLTGSKGTIGYPLLRPAGTSRQPLVGYRIIAVANVHTADAAELQFGLTTGNDSNQAARYVMRLLKERVQLGTRSGDHGPLEKVLAEKPLAGSDGFHELRLERHYRDWFVAIDDTPLGSIPVPNTAILPEFLLATEGNGTAWFSDILLEELAAPPSKP
ncbi:MAG TPA: serine/threonine-protein kinase [Planctomycetaceae bacterium]|nr:serine/threonine-protein kinase [Planctomycetaceae bacterium]